MSAGEGKGVVEDFRGCMGAWIAVIFVLGSEVDPPGCVTDSVWLTENVH